MRTLLLMRHAKSDWEADYRGDHERPLNERGVRSARAVGKALSSDGLAPNLVVTSTAVRARTTAEIAAEAGGWDCEIKLDQRLYGSGADGVVRVASELPSVDTLMLVGHQPTWSILVSVLAGERVEMKTATVAVLVFEIEDWAEIASIQGSLHEMIHPGDHLAD